jgi:hypothetical protein
LVKAQKYIADFEQSRGAVDICSKYCKELREKEGSFLSIVLEDVLTAREMEDGVHPRQLDSETWSIHPRWNEL